MGKKGKASLFELEGIPQFGQALPLALQHVVAMIVGCVTPAIIVGGLAVAKGEIKSSESILLIQAALLISGVATLVEIFSIGKVVGSGLPMVMGVSFAYLATAQSIATEFNIGTVLGAQIIGGIVAIFIGIFIHKIRKFFTPIITGTVVLTVGLSLYPVAIKYMAGGENSLDYGSGKNWAVAFITLVVVIVLNHFAKGFLKLSSILMGILIGYFVALALGLVHFEPVMAAQWVNIPKPLHFGLEFEPSAIISMIILFAINSVQAIGDYTATTMGSMDREPTNREISGGIVGYGLANIVGGFFGGFPTATFSQNVGIVTTTKVINRCVIGLAAIILIVAGFIPKFSSLLTTIPQCVLGGATISVFASITMTGMKLIVQEPLNYRNTSIVGLAVALGLGLTQVPESMLFFPSWVTRIFCTSPVVPATIIAILLNTMLPKAKDNQDSSIEEVQKDSRTLLE